MRVFVALDIRDEIRNSIREYISKLDKLSRGARWVRPEGMHLTLKFVGEASSATVEQIKSQLREIHSAYPVEMQFRGTGFFPNERRPRVLWVGIEPSKNLAEIASAIERHLETTGIPAESRKFVPHLTLARFESLEGFSSLHKEMQRLGPPDFGGERITEFHLFQSVLKRGGAEYTRLESFPFFKLAGNNS